MSSAERNRTGFTIPRTKLPLANLINVEALLMMNERDKIANSTVLQLLATRGNNMNESSLSATSQQASPFLSILPYLEELANWEKLVRKLRQSMADVGYVGSTAIGGTTDAIIKEATAQIEYLVSASSAISPSVVSDLFQRAGRALSSQDGSDLNKTATRLAHEQGLNVSEAAERVRQTTEYTTSIVKLANDILQNGWTAGDKVKKIVDDDQKALFSDFKTAKAVLQSQYKTIIAKAAELGTLCGAIYEETIPRTLGLGHSIVANGTSEDVTWMVTDCIANQDEYHESGDSEQPALVRTIVIRGYDASDENVDREHLLNRICTATPEALSNGVLVHGGLLSLARSIYKDVKPFIDLTAPQHRLVLTGHSVGGSLAVLLLFLMVQDKDFGVQFVRDKVLRVYTFGAPPVTSMPHGFYDGEVEEYLRSINGLRESDPELEPYKCDTLKAFGLSCSMVYGFVQPWVSQHDHLLPC